MRLCALIAALLLFTSTGWSKDSAQIQLGADQIEQPHYLKILAGKRIAILSNRSATDSRGRWIVDILHNNPKINLVALFTPEHGLNASKDQQISYQHYRWHNIPVYSLYGKQKRPSDSAINQADIILIDLQDVGVHYYTYMTTMAYMMQAAARNHKPVIILDRVNPVNGTTFGGPISTKKYLGKFTCLYPLPMWPGLTLGELALYFNKYQRIGATLSVIPLRHWQRAMIFSDTHLHWTAPSPALPSAEQAYLYSTFGALESLNLSVGRGKTNQRAFRYFGAPWITKKKAATIVAQLNRLKLAGLHFEPTTWTPSRAIYNNKQCHGFHVTLSHFQQVNRQAALVQVLRVLNRNLGKALGIQQIHSMLANDHWTRQALGSLPVSALLKQNKMENALFASRRSKILLYPMHQQR